MSQHKLNITDGTGQNVYVRPVPVHKLPEKLRAQADGRDTIYSLNGEDGSRIAWVISRELAFSVAREHDLVPVQLH
jgi:hypothetical protein